MYYNHGYEGSISFEVGEEFKTELLSLAEICMDGEEDGNHFYLEGDRILFIYPESYYEQKKKQTTEHEKLIAYGFAGRPLIEEKIFLLLRFIKKHGIVKKAEITPYDKTIGVRMNKIFAIDNEFFESLCIEKPINVV